jgi:hypothetical protein
VEIAAATSSGPALEHTLLELERRGGSAFASSSTRVALVIFLSRSRSNGSVMSATVSSSGPTLADGTPLRILPDGRPLLDVDGKPTPERPGYDHLQEAGVRDELMGRGWSVDGAGLRKEWLISGPADRRSLGKEVADVLATIGASDDLSLTYRAPGADAGFAQVGCAVTLASALAAGLIGLAAVFIAERIFLPSAGVIGFFAGWLTGMFVSSQALGPAVRVRRSRPNAETVAIIAGICAAMVVSVLATVVATVLIGLMSAPDQGIG